MSKKYAIKPFSVVGDYLRQKRSDVCSGHLTRRQHLKGVFCLNKGFKMSIWQLTRLQT